MDLVELQEDVGSELIVVNDVRGVIFVITLDDEVVKTSLSLNVTEIRFNSVDEVGSRSLIVDLKQLRISD